MAHRPSCSAACGIFPDQGSNLCPLHWQAESQPLRHQGSPIRTFLLMGCYRQLVSGHLVVNKESGLRGATGNSLSWAPGLSGLSDSHIPTCVLLGVGGRGAGWSG